MKITLLLLLFCLPASARIGNSLEECRTLYGQEIRSEGRNVTFQKSEFTFGVRFTDNKVAFLFIKHRDKGGNEAQSPLSDDEIKNFLTANGNGQDWKKLPESSETRLMWETVDGSLKATAKPSQGEMVILTSQEYFKIAEEAAARKKTNP